MDFPAPFGPTIATASAGWTEKEIPASARSRGAGNRLQQCAPPGACRRKIFFERFHGNSGRDITLVITEIAVANPVPSLLFAASASRIGADDLISAGRAYRIEPPSSARAAEPTQPDTTGAAAMDAPLSLHTVVVASAEQVSCPLGEEAAILNLKNSVYYGMNPVGARVWELLKQPKSVTRIARCLARRIRSGSRNVARGTCWRCSRKCARKA